MILLTSFSTPTPLTKTKPTVYNTTLNAYSNTTNLLLNTIPALFEEKPLRLLNERSKHLGTRSIQNPASRLDPAVPDSKTFKLATYQLRKLMTLDKENNSHRLYINRLVWYKVLTHFWKQKRVPKNTIRRRKTTNFYKQFTKANRSEAGLQHLITATNYCPPRSTPPVKLRHTILHSPLTSLLTERIPTPAFDRLYTRIKRKVLKYSELLGRGAYKDPTLVSPVTPPQHSLEQPLFKWKQSRYWGSISAASTISDQKTNIPRMFLHRWVTSLVSTRRARPASPTLQKIAQNYSHVLSNSKCTPLSERPRIPLQSTLPTYAPSATLPPQGFSARAQTLQLKKKKIQLLSQHGAQNNTICRPEQLSTVPSSPVQLFANTYYSLTNNKLVKTWMFSKPENLKILPSNLPQPTAIATLRPPQAALTNNAAKIDLTNPNPLLFSIAAIQIATYAAIVPRASTNRRTLAEHSAPTTSCTNKSLKTSSNKRLMGQLQQILTALAAPREATPRITNQKNNKREFRHQKTTYVSYAEKYAETGYAWTSATPPAPSQYAPTPTLIKTNYPQRYAQQNLVGSPIPLYKKVINKRAAQPSLSILSRFPTPLFKKPNNKLPTCKPLLHATKLCLRNPHKIKPSPTPTPNVRRNTTETLNPRNWLLQLFSVLHVHADFTTIPTKISNEAIRWAKKVLVNTTRLTNKKLIVSHTVNVNIGSNLITLYDKILAAIKYLPRQMHRNIQHHALASALYRMFVYKEVDEWTNHLQSWYQKHGYKKHKKIFYTLRRLLGSLYAIAASSMRVVGLYFQLKGKVNSKGGMRKRVFRAFQGRFGSSTLKTIFHYKFKRVWCKTGAIGLKTILMHRHTHRTLRRPVPNHPAVTKWTSQ